jgi:hypothetical protein
MKLVGIGAAALFLWVGIIFTAGANDSRNCEIPTLPTSSGYMTPNGRIVLIRKPKPTGTVSWQVALALGIDSSGLTTAHFHEIALSQETIVAAGRAMKRQKVGHDIIAWSVQICQISLSHRVPQWVFDEQRKTIDLYEALRPE